MIIGDGNPADPSGLGLRLSSDELGRITTSSGLTIQDGGDGPLYLSKVAQSMTIDGNIVPNAGMDGPITLRAKTIEAEEVGFDVPVVVASFASQPTPMNVRSRKVLEFKKGLSWEDGGVHLGVSGSVLRTATCNDARSHYRGGGCCYGNASKSIPNVVIGSMDNAVRPCPQGGPCVRVALDHAFGPAKCSEVMSQHAAAKCCAETSAQALQNIHHSPNGW